MMFSLYHKRSIRQQITSFAKGVWGIFSNRVHAANLFFGLFVHFDYKVFNILSK